jgi:hypothetical protein
MKKTLLACLIMMAGIIHPLTAQKIITINGNKILHRVSPMVQGHGLIYSHEADSIYEDGSMAALFQDVGAGFLRWPGGTVVTHYHWNDLNGLGWSDNWDPNYDPANDQDPANYMDLDEYIALCSASGVKPMLGINMSSGMEWNRQADALQEAKDLINYCISQNFDVKYFYLDNETYHHGNLYNKDPDNDGESWSAASYASELNAYATAIKSLIPDAKIIANWSNKLRNDSGFDTLINNAGDNIDYIDVHWYWRWDEASWDLWKSQTPIQFENQWYNGGTFVEEIEYFNNKTAQLNKPHIKMASLEWNLGPGPWETDVNHNKFKTALMQSEIQMQLIQGGLEIGAMWSTQWPGTSDESDRFLVDPDEGYTSNPTAKIFELYKNALNGQVVESSSADNQIMSLTVTKDRNKAFVYLLSKKDADQNVEFQLDGYDIISVNQSVRFKDPGEIQSISLWQAGGNYRATLKPNTLTLIEFNVEPQNAVVNGDFEEDLSAWNTWQDASISTSEVLYGNKALQLNGNASANQWVKVKPLTTYTLSAFAKLDDPTEKVVLGVTNYESKDIFDTEYLQHRIMFTTTSNTDSIKIYFWRPPGGTGASYLDQVVLKETAYILNPDFEMGLHAWNTWQSVELETSAPAEGNSSLKLNGNASINQWISLQPSTSYEISFQAKVDDASVPVTFGIQKSDGNNYATLEISDLSYTEHTINFTTDPEESDAKLFFWRSTNGTGGAYLDSLVLSSTTVLKTTSMEKMLYQDTKPLIIWPNPANELINIPLKDFAGSVNICIFNTSGKCLYHKSFYESRDDHISVPVNNFKNGLYIITINDSLGHSKVAKISIQ